MIAKPEQDEATRRLQAMLSDPDTVAALEGAIEKLPEFTAAVGLLSSFLANSSRIAENANGIVNTAREALGANRDNGNGGGLRVEQIREWAHTGSRVAEELGDPLSDPENLRSIRELLDMLPQLVATLKMLELFMENSSRFAENINSIVTTARRAAEDRWPDLMDRQGVLTLPNKLLDVVDSPALNRVLASKVLSDGALHVMDQVADATVEAHANSVAEDKRVGRIAAFRALGDPDVQRGLAFTLELARSLGRRMGEQPHPTPSANRRLGDPAPGDA
jgi:uncharacterized protein YjgD (DUF1641 family)